MGKQVRLGILGCGTVGSGVVELVQRNHRDISRKTGIDLSVKKVLVSNGAKRREVDPSLLTTEPGIVLEDQEIDIVVELIGGISPANRLIREALDRGKDVVTANKALLAEEGIPLFRRAARMGRHIGFEASVCGGIPVISALRRDLSANRIDSLCGIVNGTSNYILTRMAQENLDFDSALAEAQRLGFCETDPSFDIDGRDAAQKLTLLVGLAFGAQISERDILVQGIRGIAKEDIRSAQNLGFIVKPIVLARACAGALDARAHPALLGSDHPLAHVDREYNGLTVRGDAAGDLTFLGRGAGSLPTASAVLADILAIATNGHSAQHLPVLEAGIPIADFVSEYYLRFPILDQPGVIGRIATELGNEGISITRVEASLDEREPGRGNVRILTEATRESTLRRVIRSISDCPSLTGRVVVIRILRPEGSARPPG